MLESLDNINPKAHKFFSYASTGKERGYVFNTSHEDLKTTEVLFNIFSENYCAYCGERAKPIQSRIRKFKDYTVTGYTCICEGAFQELEIDEKIKNIRDQCNKDCRALEKELESKKNTDELKQKIISKIDLNKIDINDLAKIAEIVRCKG